MLARALGLPEFLNNGHMKMVKLLALRTDRLYPPGDTPGSHFYWRLSRPQFGLPIVSGYRVNPDKMPISILHSLWRCMESDCQWKYCVVGNFCSQPFVGAVFAFGGVYILCSIQATCPAQRTILAIPDDSL